MTTALHILTVVIIDLNLHQLWCESEFEYHKSQGILKPLNLNSQKMDC